jgi:hypothetical protein
MATFECRCRHVKWEHEFESRIFFYPEASDLPNEARNLGHHLAEETISREKVSTEVEMYCRLSAYETKKRTAGFSIRDIIYIFLVWWRQENLGRFRRRK